MNENGFLSFLVSKQKLTPPNVREIISGEAGKSAETNDADLDAFRKKIVGSGIMSEDELLIELSEYKTKCLNENVEEISPLDIILVYENEEFGKLIEGILSSVGHTITVCRDAVEAGGLLERVPCDVIIADLHLNAIDGVELASMLLENNKRLYAAALADDAGSYNLPAKLYVEPRFAFISKKESERELSSFIEKVSARKTGRASIAAASQAPVSEAAPPVDGKIALWLQATEIKYTSDGVTIFIDPARIPRAADRTNIGKFDRDLYNSFFEELKKKLSRMRIEQLDVRNLEVAFWYPWNVPIRIAPAQEPARDAKASVRLSPDGRSVTADYTPPTGKGYHIRKDVLERRIHDAATEFFFSREAFDRLFLASAPLVNVPVAEQRDGNFEIRISQDETEATLILRKSYGGNPITAETILGAVAKIGVKENLNADRIREMCYTGVWDKEIVIARGKPPANGENGKIRFIYKEKSAAAQTAPTGFDHRVVKKMDNVSKGESLLSALPPTPGVAGVNVRGKAIPAKAGKPVRFAKTKSSSDSDVIVGDNVELVMDNTFLISQIDGMVQVDGRKISVVPVYEIKGNVDYSVGNLNIKGAAVIHGSVLSKFEVHATGDIHVLGSIEDAIVSSDGSIYVEQGIYGHEKAIVCAANAVEARCIEQANVFCRGTVFAHSNISHSLVVAFDRIVVAPGKGFVVGGTLKAGVMASTPRLGGPSHTITSIEVGSTICLEEEMEKLREYMLKKISITESQNRRATTGQQEPAQKSAAQSEDAAAEELKAKYGGIRVKPYDRYFLDWLESYSNKFKLRKHIYKPGEHQTLNKVISENQTYPGVNIRIRGLNFNIANEITGKRVFSLSGDRISESV
ncbi:MAG: FapA family protein [bacterium]